MDKKLKKDISKFLWEIAMEKWTTTEEISKKAFKLRERLEEVSWIT